MKAIPFICAGLLFLSIADLPIGYFTLLRIVTTIGAIVVLTNEAKTGIGFWTITFAIIAIIFNPIIPVYLHDKATWGVIDAIAGILFLIVGFKRENFFKS